MVRKVSIKKSATEEWIISQIHLINAIKQDLPKLAKMLNALPSVQDTKEAEAKKLEQFRKKIIANMKKEKGNSLFAPDEILSPGFFRGWKEFREALGSLQADLEKIQAIVADKRVE